jgi:hypothetical protein
MRQLGPRPRTAKLVPELRPSVRSHRLEDTGAGFVGERSIKSLVKRLKRLGCEVQVTKVA